MFSELWVDPAIGIQIESVTAVDNQVIISASSARFTAACPYCQTVSERRNGSYWRKPADLSCAGLPVQMHLHVRRFFCDNGTCPCRTFGERFPQLVKRYARRTERLAHQQQQVAFATGGETGSRLLGCLGMSTSPDTLIRMIRSAPEQEAKTPRVLGIDDWAVRKGHTYGTILVDLEQQRPIDLLSDRTSETVAAWLKAHPGVEVITRDRAAEYAEGTTQGAPEAIQIADRFHLLQNLTDTLQRLLDRHPKLLREAAKQAVAEPDEVESHLSTILPAPILDGGTQSVTPVETQAVAQPETAAQLRFAEVKALQQQGWSRRAVARHLSLNVRTVNRYWRLHELPKRQHGAQSVSTVTPYLSYLIQRWQDGCQARTQLFAELQAQGYTGSYQSVWRATNHLVREGALVAGQKQPIRIPALSARKAAWLLAAPPADLPPNQQRLREKLCQVCQEAAEAYQLAQAFCQMIRERQTDVLDGWLQQAEQSIVPELKRFAAGLRRDYAAVRAALEHVWSKGQVEGQVNRLKLIKRMMFGRAKFDLLRKRVLGCPVMA